MNGGFSKRLETYVGVALLLIAVLGFIVSILLQLPKSEKVTELAKPLQVIPRDMFSSQGELNQLVQKLNTPGGVPVVVDPNSLGRSNVFQNF